MGVSLSFCSLCFYQFGLTCSCITQWAVIYTSHYLFLCSNHPRLANGTAFELAQSPSDTCPSARYSRPRIVSPRNPSSFQCREICANQDQCAGVLTVARCCCYQALSAEPANTHILTHTSIPLPPTHSKHSHTYSHTQAYLNTHSHSQTYFTHTPDSCRHTLHTHPSFTHKPHKHTHSHMQTYTHTSISVPVFVYIFSKPHKFKLMPQASSSSSSFSGL